MNSINHQPKRKGSGSFKPFVQYNQIDPIDFEDLSNEEQLLQDFLNEVCLNIFNSCFHDSCLILKVNEKQIVIDFDQINSYPLSIERHCSLKTFLKIGMETKNFLQLLLNIADEQQVKQFLETGSARWYIIREMLLKMCEKNSSLKMIIIQEGLEKSESGHYFLLNSAAFEIFPKSNWFKPSTFSMDEIQLISVQGGKMRVVNYESLRIDDISEMNGISFDLEIHDDFLCSDNYTHRRSIDEDFYFFGDKLEYLA
mmetsp:Transcript_1046/g.1052  ORF Transcript_1046/g.1052 Transcript_1046/m.1052 type:complete len:255 (+) Transcript_1046:1037-1801(+)